ncbi:serine/threonine protein kinase [Nocardia colli]|uniref:non-specific serine/threonine protein kinase n=1 Tax=Nocardia colli TaxID=2545717 RepID=A0A5N0E0N8_9NOCA|nr:serine/threonine-protein kinase [Nocardia colli]KAA8881869.1 serine/threonine protein kinase [Nocardia colli]
MAVVGDRIKDRYTLREQLGTGGMGVVWLATDDDLDRDVALKCPRLVDRQSIRRLRTEARNVARLHHPYIVSVYDFFEEDSACWLVMEYVPGHSLAKVLQEHGTLRPARAATIGWQMAEALAHAHAHGIAHRDVTPENILIVGDDIAKLTDFGISQDLWGEATRTDDATVRGKLPYLAPEVAQGRPADLASDIFSLGATLFTAVEGHSPFGKVDHPATWIARASDGAIEEPSKGGLLSEVLTQLMAPNPKRRPSAAAAVELFKKVNPPGSRTLDRIAQWRSVRSDFERRRRRRVTLAAVAVVLLVAVVGTGLIVGRSHHVSPAAHLIMLGDARTADPCALLTSQSLAGFGQTVLSVDEGNFDRCDLLVRVGGQLTGDVKLRLLSGTTSPDSQIQSKHVGNVDVLAEAVNDERCERTIALADSNRVNITGRRDVDNGPDPCALVDAATGYAVEMLNRGPIPRRPAPLSAESLISANACALLDGAALGNLPGIDALHPLPGFGNWSCRWASTIDGEARVEFDRHPALTLAEGHPMTIGGYQVFLTPGSDGPDQCAVRAEYRPYTNITGQPRFEIVAVKVLGTAPMTQRCDIAQALMTAVLRALDLGMPR